MKPQFLILILLLTTVIGNAQVIQLAENDQTFQFCSLNDIDTSAFTIAPIVGGTSLSNPNDTNLFKSTIQGFINGTLSFIMPFEFTLSLQWQSSQGPLLADYTFRFTHNPHLPNSTAPVNAICVIGFNNDSNAFEVIIDNTNLAIDSFRVEKKIANVWTELATIPSDSSKLIDNSSVFSSSQSYRVISIDTCGYERPLSLNNAINTYHSTMFLQYNGAQLTWSHYKVMVDNVSQDLTAEGFSGYNIYRGQPNQPLSLYYSGVNLTDNFYTDPNPSQTETVYQIEALKPSCDPFRSVVSIRSNKIQTGNFAGLEEENLPTHRAWIENGIFRFIADEVMNVALYTIDGKQLYLGTSSGLAFPVEQGIVICVVRNEGGQKVYKLVSR